ncbi:type II secretion system F family protein [Microbacterium azadirachtae]|uniref:Bacterial type II secretion system protein F domain protein n=1 Tax=Microbacterium azadirachtae TaxID=582680 RepID=A0A0F0LL91_9MICO|nr:type II secretion system F family protein [Microbacterium azadirachtae]KJL33050.1 Bacterial type II secretion system protein F domain protein [Microbacterium azadirachtae]
MTLLLGALLAAGVVLVASPWLWPAGERAVRIPRGGASTRLLREAGFRADARALAVSVVAGGLVAGSVAWLMTGTPAFALVLALAGAAMPVVFLRARRHRLLRLRRGLWPDVCDLLIASIRVGMPLPDAVAALEEAAPAPLRPAFAAFARDLHATGRFDAAAAQLKEALADPVGDRIVETLRMAREVGGTELTTVLRALSGSVRAEAALRAEVEARQSWIRGAAVLGAIAPWAILGLLLLRPEGASAYTSPEGVALILGGAAVSFVAFRIMLRIGRLPEPRRWFR